MRPFGEIERINLLLGENASIPSNVVCTTDHLDKFT
jgi:hypothetical protein